MNDKLIKILVELAHCDNSDFEIELRSKVDNLGFVSFFINYINPSFTDILLNNKCALINVLAKPSKNKLFVITNLNTNDNNI